MLSGVQLRTLPGENGVIDPETVRRRQARGRPLPALQAALPGEHPQHLGRQGLSARGLRRGRRNGERAWPEGSPRRRQALQRPGCDRRCRQRVVRACRHGLRVLLQGARSTSRLAARRERGDHRGGPPESQGLRGWYAAGRHYRRRLPLRLREPRRQARRGSRTRPQARLGVERGWIRGQEPETNLVLVAVDDPSEFLLTLAREGVLATPGKPGFVRFCTHLDVGEREIEFAIRAAARIAANIIER